MNMIKDNIRWGMLGAGGIAHAFVNDFKWMQNASLVAVAASDAKRVKAFAAQYDIPQALSYDELYKNDEIDAVYVNTIHHLHFKQTLQCLENGKAVLCEKPITINDKEFKKLAAAAKANHVFLMEAMWTYFLPAIQKAKQWVDEGRIGNLKVIQADFAYPMDKNTQAKMFNPELAGGSLLELGIYPIALAYYFTNKEPEKIVASGQLTSTGVDERTGVILEYGDITATLFSSIVSRMTNVGRIFGEMGYIEIPDFWRAYGCRLYDKDYNLVDTYDDNRSSNGFIYEMQHANDMILAGHFESPVMQHSRSNAIQETMTEIRRQIGLVYPMDHYL